MPILGRSVIVFNVITLVLSVGMGSSGEARAQDKLVGDLVLSLANPVEVRKDLDWELGTVGEILAIPVDAASRRRRNLPQFLADWIFLAKRGSAYWWEHGDGASSLGAEWFFPGRSMRSLYERWTRLASLKPMTPVHSGQGRRLLDSPDGTLTAGSLVGNPTSLYSRLEIRVNKAEFRLELFGFRGMERTLIYSTKVGLGSPDFPTPRGSFYVCRIFDDKPLWIPPPDRWWAWGQMPSRSVYGGHMMPFFKKVKSKGSDPAADQADLVEPEVKMIDAGMYRIHGTDSPWSVGSGQSHGCVRMKNSTVKILADSLKQYVGTTTRGRTANGPFVNLARPVKLVLY